MALLLATSGEWLSIVPTGYQYPKLETLWSDHDANWLMIRLDAALNGIEWSASEPCLMTWSLPSLEHWLENLAAGVLPAGDCWLASEPALVFLAGPPRSAHRNLIVEMAMEFRPRAHPEKKRFRVRLAVTPSALREFASGLRDDWAAFPIRHVANKG